MRSQDSLPLRIRRRLLRELYNRLLVRLPAASGRRPRAWWGRQALARFGDRSWISTGVVIIEPQAIEIGEAVGITDHVRLDGRGGISIGDHTMVGFESVVLTLSHRHDSLELPMREQGATLAPVRIGSDVWIGCRVIILPGVTIGDHAIIGAGAVVTSDIASRAIAGGVPARVVRYRE